MSEKFSLKWNDFHSNVSKSFILFRNEEYLHDVTLVSDDHKKVAAHKLVLSACSEYFRDIFKSNQDRSYLLLCLDGISSEDLINIMDYMYNGEVQIYQENLDRFLAIAQRLKLEGLIGNNKCEEVEKKEDLHVDDLQQIDEFKAHNDQNPKSPSENEYTIRKTAAHVENLSDLEEKVSEYLEENLDGSFTCTACGKSSSGQNMIKSKQKRNMKRHIVTHLQGLIYTCPICEKTTTSSENLNQHRRKYHK